MNLSSQIVGEIQATPDDKLQAKIEAVIDENADNEADMVFALQTWAGFSEEMAIQIAARKFSGWNGDVLQG